MPQHGSSGQTPTEVICAPGLNHHFEYALHFETQYFNLHAMKRLYEALIKECLSNFPCVVILGPRQCGKTTLLKTLGAIWHRFDLERQNDFEVVSRDPDLFLRLNPRHVAIDESQLLPALFPALRVAIDDHRMEPGRFVITGSSSPELLKSVSETLAGRVAVVEMAPFSFAETRQTFDSVFFDALQSRKIPISELLHTLHPRSTLPEIHQYWMQGGYPEPWLKTSPRFRKTWCENYMQTYLQRDVARLFPGLAHDRFRQFLHMLGNLSGTMINYSDVARTLAISQPTARDYVEIAHGTFVWRRIPAYAGNPLKRTVKHPKGYLRDTGLLHHLLRIPDLDVLLSHPAMGKSWEGMVIEELLRGLNGRGIDFEASHYRTAAGGEVDLILEGDFGVIPIEIKHSQTVRAQELQTLTHFITDFKCPFGIVINNDERPRLYTDRILSIPFACLG
jgi:predicted AAA+ superfamily ATPase